MISDTAIRLMQSFPRSFVNQNGEFIAHEKANEYFNLGTCKDEIEVKCKVLESLSRGAHKTDPFRSAKKNDEFHRFMLNGINAYLGTEFTADDMNIIYTELGNSVNRELSIRFINGGFDLKLLKGVE